MITRDWYNFVVYKGYELSRSGVRAGGGRDYDNTRYHFRWNLCLWLHLLFGAVYFLCFCARSQSQASIGQSDALCQAKLFLTSFIGGETLVKFR